MANTLVFVPLIIALVLQSYESAITTNQQRVFNAYKAVYYDPVTNLTLKSEIEESGRLPFTRIGFRSLPCACQDLSCGCCAGINITRIKFDQRACTNFTYDPYDFAIKMEVAMNDRKVFTNKISAKNPPPVCLPFPYIPAVDFCIRFYDVSVPDNNLHACIDFETRVVQSPILVLHFDCVKVGAGGIVWVKPEDNAGFDQPEIDNNSPTVAEPEIYDEVNFESSNQQIGANVTGSSSLDLEDEIGDQIGTLKL